MELKESIAPDLNILPNKNLELFASVVIKEIYPLVNKEYKSKVEYLKSLITEFKNLKTTLLEYKNVIEYYSNRNKLIEKQIVFIDRFHKALQLEILDIKSDKNIFDKIDSIDNLSVDELDNINSKLFQILMDRIH